MIPTIIFIAIYLLFIFSLCVAAGRADESAEGMRRELKGAE
jgi:hypothetical protein